MWFDHCHPPEPGDGNVGASRFRTKGGIYLLGQIRRTDWIPVRHGGDDDDLQLYRSELSDEDCDSDEEEREAVGQANLTDDDESSSDNNYLDPEYCAMAMDHFNNLHAQPAYQCTHSLMDDY